MKKFILIATVILLTISSLASAQQSDPWAKWKYLIGEWVGEGNGQPGKGEGSFTFTTDLDGKVLVRKNHTAFPKTNKTPATVHDDLLYVYPASGDGSVEAIYFDNEGNSIKYKVSYTDNSIVMISDKSATSPRFRLSYIKIDDRTVNIIFEMAMPDSPDSFRTYLEVRANKIR
jgi:hypothetical protein